MSATVVDRIEWGGSTSNEGHRTWDVTWLVRCTDTEDGPGQVSTAVGLYDVGTTWDLGNDSDPWAFCEPTITAKPAPEYDSEPGIYWHVTQRFTTRSRKRCQDTSPQNPLSEPFDLSGTSARYMRETMQDRNGKALVTSSHELITGNLTEIDDPRHIVNVAWNLASLNLAFYANIHKNYPLNDAVLWGMAARTIKFSDWRWERHSYGTCFYFYRLYLEFEVKGDGHDVLLANRGNYCLPEGMDPDEPDGTYPSITVKENPKNFIVHTDSLGRPKMTWLDLKGRAVYNAAQYVFTFGELLGESNLLLLGIPSSL